MDINEAVDNVVRARAAKRLATGSLRSYYCVICEQLFETDASDTAPDDSLNVCPDCYENLTEEDHDDAAP